MKIENTVFNWRLLKLDEIRRQAAIVSGTEKFPIDGQQLKFLELLHSGMSIYEAAIHHFQKNLRFSFLDLRAMLEFIASEDLIKDPVFKSAFTHLWEEPKGLMASLSEQVFGGPSDVVKVREEVRDLPLFRTFDQEMMTAVFRHSKVVNAPAKIMICQKGVEQRNLFVLLRGKAAVYEFARKGIEPRKVATLEAGSVFGEVGFFLGEPRTASVMTEEPSVILNISYSDGLLDRLTKKDGAKELQQRCRVIHAMLKTDFFRNVPHDCFDALMLAGRHKTFGAQSRLCREGELGESCYLIVQGEANVTLKGKSVRTLGTGECFGEVAFLLNRGIRTATVTSKTEVDALELTAQQFHKLLAGNVDLGCIFEAMAKERMAQDKTRVS